MLSRTNLDHPPDRRKPAWLRVRAPGGEGYLAIRQTLRERGLHTVCEEARCPNMGECWQGGTATFMLLGDTCTRACGFCAVKTGNPRGRVEAEEPRRVAEAVAEMRLRYVVLTTVDRDDLEDGGAAHHAATIRAIRARHPGILVEALVGDFLGAEAALRILAAETPDVFAHNVETVRRLVPVVRDRRCDHDRSLAVLQRFKRLSPGAITKSSIMLGLGEREEEVLEAMEELRAHDVDVLTLGQYLRPTPRHLPVAEYVEPERFDRLAERGRELGFLYVASGPLVRSSYRAGEHFIANVLERRRAGGALPGRQESEPT